MIHLRAASESDIPLLRSLADTIWRTHYPGIISEAQIDYMLTRMYAPEAIRDEMRQGVIWELGEVDQQPAGFLACTHEPDAATLKLNKLYLLPAWQGRGLGRQMLDAVKARAVQLAAKQISLTVNKRNARAIAAYQRAGFQIAESVDSDIGGGFVMDDFVMTLEVAG